MSTLYQDLSDLVSACVFHFIFHFLSCSMTCILPRSPANSGDLNSSQRNITHDESLSVREREYIKEGDRERKRDQCVVYDGWHWREGRHVCPLSTSSLSDIQLCCRVGG